MLLTITFLTLLNVPRLVTPITTLHSELPTIYDCAIFFEDVRRI
jgi:hypothetical protein